MLNTDSLRVVFAGTPQFAVPALQALDKSRHRLCAVYTQPDRPAGRGRKLTASPVKQCAETIGCPVLQPHTLAGQDAQDTLAGFAADVLVGVAYGLILPSAILTTPRFGCLNIHASLLPRWRGAAPIQRAILCGDQQTGITIMQMDAGLDTGDMLHRTAVPIASDDTSQTMHDKLAASGADALLAVLDELIAAKLAPQPQDDSLATYAEKLQKSEARMDWSRSAVALHQQVRAFVPWPVAECRYAGERLRVWSSELAEYASEAPPGSVVRADKGGIDVATGDGVLRLLRVQLPGGKPLGAEQFLAAHDLSGEKLG